MRDFHTRSDNLTAVTLQPCDRTSVKIKRRIYTNDGISNPSVESVVNVFSTLGLGAQTGVREPSRRAFQTFVSNEA